MAGVNKLFVIAGVILPYPNKGSTLVVEIILLFLFAVIEAVRLFFGKILSVFSPIENGRVQSTLITLLLSHKIVLETSLTSMYFCGIHLCIRLLILTLSAKVI